jgi:hypothetical protein
MNHDDTYDKDGLSQHWFTTYQVGHVVTRIRQRGGNRGDVRETDDTAQPLALAFIMFLP